MVCPSCHQSTAVTNSRRRQPGFSIWRRRRCKACNQTFTTTESINTESIIALKDEYGDLKPLRYLDIYVSVFKALGGLKELSETAERLAQVCFDKLLQKQSAVLSVESLHQEIFAVLNAYQKTAGQRYRLEEMPG